MFKDYTLLFVERNGSTIVAVDKTLYERTKENARLLQEENNKLTDEIKALKAKLDSKCYYCPAMESEKNNREVALANQRQTYKAELKKQQEAYNDLRERYFGLKLTYETMLKAHESMVKSLAKQLAKEEEE